MGPHLPLQHAVGRLRGCSATELNRVSNGRCADAVSERALWET